MTEKQQKLLDKIISRVRRCYQGTFFHVENNSEEPDFELYCGEIDGYHFDHSVFDHIKKAGPVTIGVMDRLMDELDFEYTITEHYIDRPVVLHLELFYWVDFWNGDHELVYDNGIVVNSSSCAVANIFREAAIPIGRDDMLEYISAKAEA